MGMTIDSLQLLQQLAAKGLTAESSKAEKGTGTAKGEDYQSVLARIEAEEKEWQQTLDNYERTKATLSMADSFWAGKTENQNFMLKYMQRQQQQENQKTLNSLMTHLMTLQRVNFSAAKSGTLDADSAFTINQQINKALQGTFMLTVMNMNHGFSGLNASIDFSKL